MHFARLPAFMANFLDILPLCFDAPQQAHISVSATKTTSPACHIVTATVPHSGFPVRLLAETRFGVNHDESWPPPFDLSCIPVKAVVATVVLE
jgi:hypothetical protein